MNKEGQPSRRFKGFEPAGSLLRQQIRKVSEDRGFAVARLLTHWPEIAGPDVAPVTRPVKVSYGQGGFGATLTLLVKGASAPIIEAQLEQLKTRVNACYGYNAIARIRLTQTAGELLNEPPKSAPEPPASQPEAAQIAAGVGDATLREALEALGNRVLSQSKDKGRS
ncbi:MAG: DciA family protein [Deltaproteobacteria bacterium]